MKKEFRAQPACFDGQEMYGFSWMEHVIALPSPLAVVTTYKMDGKTNATLQSWLTFSNDGDFYCIFASVYKDGHMYRTTQARRALVINFPSADVFMKCHATIYHNHAEDDEIPLSGLTAEPASCVDAPRIAECFLNLECEYAWEKELFPGSDQVVMCVKVINVVMDEAHYDAQQLGRYGGTGYLYNVHAPVNPATGATGTTCVAMLAEFATYDELTSKYEG